MNEGLSRRRLTVMGAISLAAVIAVMWVPRWQESRARLGVGPDDKAERSARLINEYRLTMIQIVGGALVLFGAYTAWRQMIENREAQRAATIDGQITDRFTKAVAQLGDKKMAVRLGGIYALECIARDSLKDQWTIVETLSAFIRAKKPVTDAFGSEPPPLRTDLQAAVTVLGRRRRMVEPGHIDLSGANLSRVHLDKQAPHLEGADLRGASLKGATLIGLRLDAARLEGAHLEGAVLVQTHLEGATLEDAHLEGANLFAAHLERAYLPRAHLEGATLIDAHLENAVLHDAHLEGATLIGAHLEGAILGGAHLDGADLEDAHLEDAHLSSTDLSRVKNLTADQVRAARTDVHTKFPWPVGDGGAEERQAPASEVGPGLGRLSIGDTPPGRSGPKPA